MYRIILFLLLALPVATSAATFKLSADQKAKGWRMLFNGKNLEGWRTYPKGGKIGDAWQIKDGVLVKVAGKKGGNPNQQYQAPDGSWVRAAEWDDYVPPPPPPPEPAGKRSQPEGEPVPFERFQ